MDLAFELLTAGYCMAGRHHALRGAPKESIRFYATYGMWEHPTLGYILFDTGYTRRFYEETKSFPASVYARMTKVDVKEEDEAVTVLRRHGIQPEDIKHIVVSHFHSDHVCGLKDFPDATIICTREAYEHAKSKRGFAAVRRGYLPGLMPSDIEDRVWCINFDHHSGEDPDLGPLVDLFADGSIHVCQLPGHARGQIGALFTSNGHTVFLASDAAWLDESYRENHLPHWLVRSFFDSWGAFKSTLSKVHAYHKAHPETIIVPCHSNKARLDFDSHGTKKIWAPSHS